MDAFGIRDGVVDDYREFTTSFVEPRDSRISELLAEKLAAGRQWPDPWISLNPFFASGGTIAEAVADGDLHPECERIFRVKAGIHDEGSAGITLHRHQRDAVRTAGTGQSYVLTTGTGSGKSLAYIVPIVDRVLRERAADPQRAGSVKAIIVYPMNALANSQLHELEKFLTNGYGEGREPVTFARYTGQEDDEQRRRIMASPPDVLLTNYVMLELLLTRPDERQHLIRAARGLDFLVLDELHTYRGRQGADVAMLVRRLRDACEAPDLQCIGTSATMASGGSRAEQKATVADVASRLFGAEVTPDRVIGETLVRATDPAAADDLPALRDSIASPAPGGFAALAGDPLASWVEGAFGLAVDDEGVLVRQRPTTVTKAAAELAELTGLSRERCEAGIRRVLDAGSRAKHPQTGRPLFAFRIHQFLSKGDNLYTSLEPVMSRHLTGRYQVAVPNAPEKALFPLAFCRECGQEYLVVARERRDGGVVLRRREDTDGTDGTDAGYFFVSDGPDALPWPRTNGQVLSENRLPDSWTSDATGETLIADNRRDRVPVPLRAMPDGTVTQGAGTGADIVTTAHTEDGTYGAFVPSPFAFCLRCQVSYEALRGSEFSRLASLSVEGRASAVSVISTSVVRRLRAVTDPMFADAAKKLLTFVDNRQDASLQSGHVNDYVSVSMLRAALHRATVAAGNDGLDAANVAWNTLRELGLAYSDYGREADPAPRIRKMVDQALHDLLQYRLLVDLERGWRITMPNLEQTGLLRIGYLDLDWLAGNEARWAGSHQALVDAEPELREELLRVLLDEMRRSLAIEADVLTFDGFDRVRSRAQANLLEPWSMEPDEKLADVRTAYPRGTRKGSGTPLDALFLSGRGAYGRYLRRGELAPQLKVDEAQEIIADLLRVAADAGLLREVGADSDGVPGYRLNAEVMSWRPGTGDEGVDDPLRRSVKDEAGPRVNPFFRDLYRGVAGDLAGLRAREHTAQVPSAVREEREEEFRNADLPLLFCSPTMELGVDIAELNAVMMRNVPPTPANYAQRSGRAGRSGQAALVLTYCAAGNAHDSYYFQRSDQMVAGSVAPPRLDLANEDLLRSHVHAIWLAEAGVKLGKSMLDVIDAAAPGLPLHPHVAQQLGDPDAERRAAEAARRMLAGIADDLAGAPWWDPEWPRRAAAQAARRFDAACSRWRELYRAAAVEQQIQNDIVNAPTTGPRARKAAEARRFDAENQKRLLINEDAGSAMTDFYPYRYFASEGFLPGYSFPRLPLAAYIPSRRRRIDSGDYLQRARFLAISEFGPGALVYHEGARYQVDRVQLPGASPTDPGAIHTIDIKRCPDCGYLHDTTENVDDCLFCGARLATTTYGLMQLRTVFTRRRERISSDEEERRRTSFDLEYSYRFADRGARPGFTRATAVDADGLPLLELTHGDAATVRVVNKGTRKSQEEGFWLDTVRGKWLSDRQASQTTTEGELDDAGQVTIKRKVIPYVEDTRNVLVVRSTAPVSQVERVSLATALERGIEAAFQLEGGELVTQELPDGQDRGRTLFMEANEGGAGVLRRFVDDAGAVALAARTALSIAHFDPGTGEDLLAGATGDDRCENACYDCLLSYSNQRQHSLIDRHAVRDLLLSLAGSRALPEQSAAVDTDGLRARCESDLERAFLDLLIQRDHRLPDAAQELLEDAAARPDFLYRTATGGRVAVFIDGPHHDTGHQAQRDSDAEARLYDLGIDVVRFGHDEDWPAKLADYGEVFGKGK